MSTPYPKEPSSPLRARMIEDMCVRGFSPATQAVCHCAVDARDQDPTSFANFPTMSSIVQGRWAPCYLVGGCRMSCHPAENRIMGIMAGWPGKL